MSSPPKPVVPSATTTNTAAATPVPTAASPPKPAPPVAAPAATITAPAGAAAAPATTATAAPTAAAAPSAATAPTAASSSSSSSSPQQQQQQPAAAAAGSSVPAAADAPTAALQQAQQSTDPVIVDLQNQLSTLETEATKLKGECEAAEKEASDASLTSGTVKQKVRELTDSVQAAQRIRATLQREHDELQAAVDHGKANADLNSRSANSKSMITLYEEQLGQKEQEDISSKQLLEDIAAQYKRVAERKKQVIAAVRSELDELAKQIRINATHIPLKVASAEKNEAKTEEDPAEQLDILADLAASRESDLRDAERHLREAEAIVQLKQEEIVRLEAETDQRLAERRRERDEEIKRMVFGFQDDRKALHDDVSEMRRANADQKTKLVRGHIQEVPHSTGDATEVFLQSATRAKTSPRAKVTARHTHLKPKSKKSTEEVHLEEHNAEIEDALRAAMHELSEEHRQKSEVAKNIKSITERIKKDELAFSQKIMQLQAAASSENARARKAEAENERLCADVQHFSEVLENTRRNIERVRGHSAPLPVE